MELLEAVTALVLVCGSVSALGYGTATAVQESERRQRVRRRQQINREAEATIRRVHERYREAAEQAVRQSIQSAALRQQRDWDSP